MKVSAQQFRNDPLLALHGRITRFFSDNHALKRSLSPRHNALSDTVDARVEGLTAIAFEQLSDIAGYSAPAQKARLTILGKPGSTLATEFAGFIRDNPNLFEKQFYHTTCNKMLEQPVDSTCQPMADQLAEELCAALRDCIKVRSVCAAPVRAQTKAVATLAATVRTRDGATQQSEIG